jgi:hypothetical protein
MDISPATIVIIACVVGFGIYLAFVLRESADEFARPKLPERPQQRGLRQASKKLGVTPANPGMGAWRSPDPTAPAPAPTSGDALPTLRPPEGVVAASTQAEGRLDGDTGGGDSTEAAGLLRILASASDIQRQAAAKALSLPFAGSCNPEVAVALANLVGEGSATTSVRAEAWIALRAVMGEELSWEEEVAARHAFPEGLDEVWLAQIQGA